MTRFFHQPHGERLGDVLRHELSSGEWTRLDAAVAFVRRAGVNHLADSVRAFLRTGRVRFVVGIDLEGSSYEGMAALMAILDDPNAELWVFHNDQVAVTFHPKVFAFSSAERARIVVGSGNLTEGGLYRNYEAAAVFDLDLTSEADAGTWTSLQEAIDGWSNTGGGAALRLDAQLLADLLAEGYLPPERLARSGEAAEGLGEPQEARRRRRFFESLVIPAPPPTETDVAIEPAQGVAEPAATRARAVAEPRAAPITTEEPGAPAARLEPAASTAGHIGFLMTLHQTDVGRGQVTPGAQRRSAEIFVPLAARDFDPDFWGWPDLHIPDPDMPDKRDRQPRLRLGSEMLAVTTYNWPPKHDYRIRGEALRSAASVGDILRLERAPEGAPFDYYVEMVPQGTTHHARYLAMCTNPVKNSPKRWGYY